MHNHRPRNHFRDIVQAVTLLILLGVAIKKFIDWMQKHQESNHYAGHKAEKTKGKEIAAELTKALVRALTAKAVSKAVSKSQPIKSATHAKPAKLVTKPAINRRSTTADLNQRQQKIYDMFREQHELNMQSIIKAAGSGISSRTLRRDMTHLENLGLISQSGRTKNSIYKLI